MVSSHLRPPSNGHVERRRSTPGAASSEGEEEADNHTMTRMLVDPHGRLCEFVPLLQILSTVSSCWPFSSSFAQGKCEILWVGSRRNIGFCSRHLICYNQAYLRIVLILSACTCIFYCIKDPGFPRIGVVRPCPTFHSCWCSCPILLLVMRYHAVLTTLSVRGRHGDDVIPTIDPADDRINHRPHPHSLQIRGAIALQKMHSQIHRNHK